jgi:hypothetical protein
VQDQDTGPVEATPGAIVPVSAGQYALLSADEKAGTFPGEVSDADIAGYDRNLYQVVQAPGAIVPDYLADLFGDGFGFTSTGEIPFICEPADDDPATTTAGDLIKANGSFSIGTACGTFQ